MKKVIRWIVARLVRWTDKHCCRTYGDVAELSKGPCQRCCGMEVRGAPASPATPNDRGQAQTPDQEKGMKL